MRRLASLRSDSTTASRRGVREVLQATPAADSPPHRLEQRAVGAYRRPRTTGQALLHWRAVFHRQLHSSSGPVSDPDGTTRAAWASRLHPRLPSVVRDGIDWPQFSGLEPIPLRNGGALKCPRLPDSRAVRRRRVAG